jgi:uncharacterized protein YceH (UPF0502 family)
MNRMNIHFTAEQARIIGCLMEKAITTPDQYPLSLNALTNACNQKSSRDPVMALTEGTVMHTLRELEDAALISITDGRVSRFSQRFSGTMLAECPLSPEEHPIICVLLLRGPQTPGELKTRCARLHAFTDADEVNAVLEGLIDHERGTLVSRLPRQPGRQDHQYAQTFTGEVTSVSRDEPAPTSPAASRPTGLALLETRVAALEQALTDLAARLGEDIELASAPAPHVEDLDDEDRPYPPPE